MPTNDRESIASEVRAELARQDIRHGKVAEWLGVTKQSASRRLTGHQPFRAEELAVVARQLGVPVERFYPDAAPVGAV